MRRLSLPAFLLAVLATGTADACFLKCFCGKRSAEDEGFRPAPYLKITSVDNQAPDPTSGKIASDVPWNSPLAVEVESNIQTTDPGPTLELYEDGPWNAPPGPSAALAPKLVGKYKRYKHEPKYGGAAPVDLRTWSGVWLSFFTIPGSDVEGKDLRPGYNYHLVAKATGIPDSYPVYFRTKK
jgi:hypothetical protein